MRVFFLLAFLFCEHTSTWAQTDSDVTNRTAFEKKMLATYQNLKGSPDEKSALQKLTSLPFYSYDPAYQVEAVIDTSNATGFFDMQTSKGRPVKYRTFGHLTFVLKGKSFRIPVFQSRSSITRGNPELFFPFTDLTNDAGTYPGGRYIDIPMPRTNMIRLDFNYAYNPYCAYSHMYSCEIVPSENRLDLKIEAGLKFEE